MKGQLIIESETREKRSRFHDRDTVSFYPCDEHTSQYASHKEYIREVDEDDRHSKSRIQRSRQYIWNYESYAQEHYTNYGVQLYFDHQRKFRL